MPVLIYHLCFSLMLLILVICVCLTSYVCALALSVVSGALPSLKLGHGCRCPYVSKFVYWNQEWSYSEVDIALDSESIGRGFESHYDQFFLSCCGGNFVLAFVFVSCVFQQTVAYWQRPQRYSGFLWRWLVPRPQLPSRRIVTECRISPVLMHPYQPVLLQWLIHLRRVTLWWLLL